MPGEAATAVQIPLFDVGPNVVMLRDRAALIVLSAQAENTRRAYASDWRRFSAWCRSAGREALPASADTLRLFIAADLEAHAIATVERRVAAVVDRHRSAKLASPLDDEIRELMRGARRAKGAAPNQKAALTPVQLRQICMRLLRDGSGLALRDRAILTLGFAAAMRRSEISALDLCDIRHASQGVALTLRRSKTDQESRGREVGVFRGRRVSTCPVRSLAAWLKVRGKKPGPLFPGGRLTTTGRLSSRAIGEAVKRCVALIGLDPAAYGAHSLRAGCVTAAILAGAQTPLIMKRTGHRSIATLEKYVRTATLFSTDVLSRAM